MDSTWSAGWDVTVSDKPIKDTEIILHKDSQKILNNKSSFCYFDYGGGLDYLLVLVAISRVKDNICSLGKTLEN